MITKTAILAGECVFTIELPAGKVPRHYCYAVDRVPANDKFKEAWFVKLLWRPDDVKDNLYLGQLDVDTGYVRRTGKSVLKAGSWPLVLLNKTLSRIWGSNQAAYERHGYKVLVHASAAVATVATAVAAG